MTLPKGQAQQLKLTLEAVEPLLAPITPRGNASASSASLSTPSLWASIRWLHWRRFRSASLFGRAWDTVRLWFK